MGISALVASGLGALGVGSETAAAIAPVLSSAAIGTGLSALTGGNLGTGALMGAGMGLMNNPALAGLINGPGQAATPAGSAPAAATGSAAAGGALSGNSAVPAGASLAPGGALAKTAGGIAGGLSNTSKLLAGLMLAGQYAGQPNRTPPSPQGPTYNAQWNPSGYLNRTATPNYQPATGSWSSWGQAPEPQFYSGNQLNFPGYRRGGRAGANDNSGALGRVFDTDSGEHFVRGGGDGTSDSQPAQLSDGEYVLTAADVSRIGNGSSDAGAKKLDAFRKHLAHEAGARQFQPRLRKPLRYLKPRRA